MALSRRLKASEQQLLERCRELIREVIPSATIILGHSAKPHRPEVLKMDDLFKAAQGIPSVSVFSLPGTP